MLAVKEIKEKAVVFSSGRKNTNSSSELKFITELGRNLLFTVHPKKVANCVAQAVQRKVSAEVCAIVVELENVGLVSCAFNSECSEERTNFLRKRAFKKWLEVLPPQVSVWTEDDEKFLLKGESHSFEYVSPLHINAEVKGAVIVGFKKKTGLQ